MVSSFERTIVEIGLRKLLKLELSVRPGTWKDSMRGCAMLVVNPPHGFDRLVSPMLHWLWKALSPEGDGRYRTKWLVGE